MKGSKLKEKFFASQFNVFAPFACILTVYILYLRIMPANRLSSQVEVPADASTETRVSAAEARGKRMLSKLEVFLEMTDWHTAVL